MSKINTLSQELEKDRDWDLEAKQMREDEDDKFAREMENACVPDYDTPEFLN